MNMNKQFIFWFKAAAIMQVLTGIIHSLSFFNSQDPANETERQLIDLMKTYKPDMGAGFHPSTEDIFISMSASFTLLLFFSGMVNFYLIQKVMPANVMKGVLNINLVVYAVCFALMLLFTFLPPIICVGLIFLLLIITRIVAR